MDSQRRKSISRLNLSGRRLDARESERRKQIGMRLAALKRPQLLKFCQRITIRIALARADREATSDDMHAWMQRHFPEIDLGVALGNAAGSLFRGGMWEKTGKRVACQRVSSHSTELIVWRLKDDYKG